jgi:hypothetical protein
VPWIYILGKIHSHLIEKFPIGLFACIRIDGSDSGGYNKQVRRDQEGMNCYVLLIQGMVFGKAKIL